MPKLTAIVPVELIENKIFIIRGQKVMKDRDLALLYGVETKVLNQAVKRNASRFPHDFMFKLIRSEYVNLKSQFVTSSLGHGGRRKPPLVFTELGISMLSSVLKSERAVQVNIQIMRTFTRLRQMMADHKELRLSIEALEKKYAKHDFEIQNIFAAIRSLISEKRANKSKPIGFLRA